MTLTDRAGASSSIFRLVTALSFPLPHLPVKLPEKAGVKVPLDVALSMLRPDEREKLKNYVVAYLAKHNNGGEG